MKVYENRITREERTILANIIGQRITALVSTCDKTMSDEDVFIRTDDRDIRFHNTEEVPPSCHEDFSRAVISEGEIGSFRISWAKSEPRDAWDESYWEIVRIGKIVRKVVVYDTEMPDSDCDDNHFIDKDTRLIVFVFDDSCLVLQRSFLSIMWTMSYQDSPEVDFNKLFAIDGTITAEEL